MDKKKQTFFRGAHPVQYHGDAVSIASTVRSKSISGTATLNANLDRQSQGGKSNRSSLSTSQRLQQMSTRASGRLIDAHKMGNTSQVRKVGLKEYIAENQAYKEAVDQINQKLALKDAIDRANDAISQSKAHSRGWDPKNFDARSKASTVTALSMVSMSQKSGATGSRRGSVRDDAMSFVSEAPSKAETMQSKTELRSTAHELVTTLQVQLERERQQKRKLMEHLA